MFTSPLSVSSSNNDAYSLLSSSTSLVHQVNTSFGKSYNDTTDDLPFFTTDIPGPNATVEFLEKTDTDVILSNQYVQILFCLLYSSILILGLFGNVLVCYVVCRNKAMQTVTNLFITNLALSDILLCILAVPFTPSYTFLGNLYLKFIRFILFDYIVSWESRVGSYSLR